MAISGILAAVEADRRDIVEPGPPFRRGGALAARRRRGLA
jgi:hypothetical protein